MALAEIGPAARDAVPALIETLKDREVEVRGSAVYALGEIGPAARAALPMLGVLLKDDNADIRKAAAIALGKIQEGDGE